MIDDLNTSAIAGINAFLWHRLQADLDWEKINNNVPIVSPQQEPELNSGKQPFLVFNWTYDGQQVMIEMKSERAGYMVYSTDIRDVTRGVGLIVDLLGRFDWSAQDVNDYIDEHGTAKQKLYEYKYINVISANGPEPAASEGGRHEGNVMIAYAYTFAMGDNGRRLFD